MCNDAAPRDDDEGKENVSGRECTEAVEKIVEEEAKDPPGQQRRGQGVSEERIWELQHGDKEAGESWDEEEEVTGGCRQERRRLRLRTENFEGEADGDGEDKEHGTAQDEGVSGKTAADMECDLKEDKGGRRCGREGRK
ncbi:hypothetical protein MTO96_010088 [Rhipicephalus appendiculatus]